MYILFNSTSKENIIFISYSLSCIQNLRVFCLYHNRFLPLSNGHQTRILWNVIIEEYINRSKRNSNETKNTLIYIDIIKPTFGCKKYWRRYNSFPSSVSSRLESMWHWLAPLRVFDALSNPWSFSLSSGKLWIAAHV